MVRNRMSVSINHYRKLHMGFRLVPTSVATNDLERCNSHYFTLFHRISPNLITLQANYVTVVEDFILKFEDHQTMQTRKT